MHYKKFRKHLLLFDKNLAVGSLYSMPIQKPLKAEELVERACPLFFPGGKNNFAGHIEKMNKWSVNIPFADEGYLKSNGLCPR